MENLSNRIRFKYLFLLSTIIIALYMITAVVQNRLISLNGFNISAAVLVYPFSYLFSDVCTEIYGYRATRQVIWCCLLTWLLSAVFIQLIIYLPTPHFWSGYSHDWNVTMSPYLRTIMSGVIAVLSGQFINIYIIAKFKILTQGRFFWIRSILSCLVGDIVTMVIALTLIFVGRMSFHYILELMLYELCISILIQSIGGFLSIILVNKLKKSENIDIYDNGVNFNPFIFKVE